MKLLVILTAIAALPGIQILPKGKIQNPTHRESVLAVYGIFACIVLISHASYSYDLSFLLNTFPKSSYFFDQLTVVPFLLFSGYGIALSIDTKPDYAKKLPTQKILKTWLHFALVNVLMIVLSLFCGEKFPVSDYYLSFIGMRKPLVSRLGNCSWFVFVLLALYLFVYLSYLLFQNDRKAITVMTSALWLIATIFLWYIKIPDYYWNTAFLFPCGMFFYAYREKLLRFFSGKIHRRYIAFFLFLIILIAGEKAYRKTFSDFFFIPAALAFAGCMLLFLSKVRLHNRLFIFIGKHAFEIYIIQGVPMKLAELCETKINPDIYNRFTVLQPLFFNESKLNPYVYILTAMASSILLAALFRAAEQKIDRLLFKRERRTPT